MFLWTREGFFLFTRERWREDFVSHVRPAAPSRRSRLRNASEAAACGDKTNLQSYVSCDILSANVVISP